MKKIVINFILKLFILSALILIGEVIYFIYTPKNYDIFYILLISIFFIATSLSFLFQVKSLTKKPAKFFHITMLFTGVRILVYLAFIIIYVLATNTEKIAIFAILFFLMYIIYTVFELKSILNVLKLVKNITNNNENNQNIISENK